jgi:hypothetical protein
VNKIGFLFKDEFYHIIDEVFEYLASQRSNIGEMSGWHQFLESGKIGNIATAQIILLHNKYDRPISDLDSCLAWFRTNKKQIKWQNDTVHGWSYLSSGPAVPCIEPTCWVCLAYQKLSIQETARVESDVYAFLNATKIPSQYGIAWGFIPWTEPRVSPTCIAIRTLRNINNQNLIDDAVRWLLAARDSQNAWGSTARSSATLTHTALAILALREAGYNQFNPALLDGYAFLAKQLRQYMNSNQSRLSCEDNMGFMEIIDVPPCPPYEQRPTRIQYFYNPFLLSAIALSSNSEQYLHYIETVAIKSITDWRTTRWKHPFLREHQHITSWSIYDHLSVLEPFRHEWFGNKKSLLAYGISSNGALSFSVGRIGNILLTFRNRYVIFFIRLIIFVGVAMAVAYYLLDGLKTKDTVIAVTVGVISDFVFDYLKRKIFTK